ncbi:MAG: hypothetical protein HRU51_08820 [Xanthomonadales bacterium]|nr:hypothetical protein [Xanthomonadales bacterium]
MSRTGPLVLWTTRWQKLMRDANDALANGDLKNARQGYEDGAALARGQLDLALAGTSALVDRHAASAYFVATSNLAEYFSQMGQVVKAESVFEGAFAYAERWLRSRRGQPAVIEDLLRMLKFPMADYLALGAADEDTRRLRLQRLASLLDVISSGRFAPAALC